MVNPKRSYDLVVLAAGMGSRFGGIKQVQPVGPHGELIIEYSAYDALRAGFGRLVLVIRKDIEADFRDTIGRRLEQRMDVAYVFQEMDALPGGFAQTNLSGGQVPPRTKPWGTAHATLVAQAAVRGPFAVINADDFYGASAYRTLSAHFAASADYAMVGYPLSQTLSEHGTVSRGLCATDAAGRLRGITEITKIEKTESGARYTDAAGQAQQLTGEEIVSMNFWGFTPAVFPQLEAKFETFLKSRGSDPKAEIYLPTTLSELNQSGEAKIALHRSEDAWFGLTYKEDLASAQGAIKALVAEGKYPAPLWK
ncbi:MobA-like NTP transferase domain protein [Lacunisphaera limnophila]|uniref:MobA-like NTP transferase domain protein n=1 Tax=Lacunisphaera limnophila TaxID=1838286 RepID=A0A1D8AYV5_9BACT|nr:MobA-like NTP transferase domain protein [Lacunisphaera limnophila]